MWRELITELHKSVEPIGDLDPGPEFFPGATTEQLADAERQLGVELLGRLKDLLSEKNGVHVIFGTHLIWSTDEMLQRNLEMRTLDYKADWMPLDHLLFFGDVGADGICFAFGVIQGKVRHETVYS